jgi:hypothetical protein
VQPPSQMEGFLPVLRKPLFAEGTGKQICRQAGHAPIAAVHTCRLHADFSHPPSPPLLVFAFVLFDKRQQFFVSQTRVHAVKPSALALHLKRGDLPQAPNFGKFFFAESAFDNEKPVDMTKQGVVIMDRCDKRDAVAELCFDVLKGFSS